MDKIILRQHARDLRKNSTDAEKHLWYNLRANRLGYKFKRQVPIGDFIVDFVCIEKSLIVELDGGQHQTNETYDAQRTSKLNKRGFQVLRFWNHDVLQQTKTVLEIIGNALSPALSRVEHHTIINAPCAGEGVLRANTKNGAYFKAGEMEVDKALLRQHTTNDPCAGEGVFVPNKKLRTIFH